MSKTHKVVILLLLAAICAVISGFLIYTYCNSSKGFIYVFNKDYPAGTRITKDMFYSIKVDSSIIENGKKSGLETYYITDENFNKALETNEYLLNDVIKDQPLTFVNLAFSSGTSIERSLSSNTLAVTVPISGSAAVTDKLRVGSVVNIYKSDEAETRLIFENMKIIARNSGDNIDTVTFETNEDDTLDLINAVNNYKLYFALSQPILDENAHVGYVENGKNVEKSDPNVNTMKSTEEQNLDDAVPQE